MRASSQLRQRNLHPPQVINSLRRIHLIALPYPNTMPAHTPIPDIPGELLTDPTLQYFLAERVSNLCGIGGGKFPGSQPVSFSSSSLDLLEKEDFWVCEKSDGVRVLVFIVVNQSTEQQEVWLVSYFVTDIVVACRLKGYRSIGNKGSSKSKDYISPIGRIVRPSLAKLYWTASSSSILTPFRVQ